MPRIEEPPEPWRSFFAEVDSRLSEDVHLHCCGGFVVAQFYGVARTTSDVDFLGVVPNVRNDLARIGGKGSALHQKHKVYLDLSPSLRRPKTTRTGWCPCSPTPGVVFGSSLLRPMTWLSPNWSETWNVIVTTCGSSHARAT
jgi:hypothetical protein